MIRFTPYVPPRYRRSDYVAPTPPVEFVTFGQRVREARKALGLTQTDLASLLRSLGHRVHASNVCNVEQGIEISSTSGLDAWIVSLRGDSKLRSLHRSALASIG